MEQYHGPQEIHRKCPRSPHGPLCTVRSTVDRATGSQGCAWAWADPHAWAWASPRVPSPGPHAGPHPTCPICHRHFTGPQSAVGGPPSFRISCRLFSYVFLHSDSVWRDFGLVGLHFLSWTLLWAQYRQHLEVLNFNNLHLDSIFDLLLTQRASGSPRSHALG